MTGNRGIIGRAAGLGLLAGLALCLWPAAPAAGDVIGQWSTATLSQGRYGIAATSVGGMAFFAGGFAQTGGSNVVDIYNSSTHSWSTGPALWTRYLSAPPQATSAGGKAFFTQGSDLTIFDTGTSLWSSIPLPSSHAQGAVASAGGLVFFAGGGYETRVDILDPASGTWSTGNLSQGRYNLVGASGGGKVFFAGGIKAGYSTSAVIDIYDTATGRWSTSRLSEARAGICATPGGGKVFFAGGEDIPGGLATDAIDVFDLNLGTWSTRTLSLARTRISGTSVDGLVFLAGGFDLHGNILNRTDVFDTLTGKWSTLLMPSAATEQGATSFGDQAFFAGGQTNSTFYGKDVYVFTVPEPATLALFCVGFGVLLVGLRMRPLKVSPKLVSRIGNLPKNQGPPVIQCLEDRALISGSGWTWDPDPGQGLIPLYVRRASGLNNIPGGFAAEGKGQTIAVVVAFHDPNIAVDLGIFSDAMGLTRMDMDENSGHLTVVDQDGLSPTDPYFAAPVDPGWPDNPNDTEGAFWDYETSLDVEWVHAMAPRANIVVVEATNDHMDNFLAAVDTARNYPGVTVVSMSWQFGEFAGESAYDSYFTPSLNPHVTFVSASGDKGTTVQWPGISKNVLSGGRKGEAYIFRFRTEA